MRKNQQVLLAEGDEGDGKVGKDGNGKTGKKVRTRPHGIARVPSVIRLIEKYREAPQLVPVRLGRVNTLHHAQLLRSHKIEVPADYHQHQAQES